MEYHVEIADRAFRDLEILYMEKNAAESHAAARWYNGLEAAVFSLASHPQRRTLAPEARSSKRKLRNLLYGKNPHVYRVIFEIDEGRQAVSVLTIRHGARRRFRRSDLT